MERGKFDDLVKARARAGAVGTIARAGNTVARTGGKRSNDEYRQVSAYVRKDTHRRVKMALLEQDREFSDLVEELLNEWLDSRS